MKRFLIGLLAVGLIAAISMPAVAADVKFGGEFYAAGYMEKNRGLQDPQVANQGFYAQRLRLDLTFKVAEGLSLVTRSHILEKVWGQGRVGSLPGDSEDRQFSTATTNRYSENIEIMRAYVDAKLGPGSLRVGYHPTGTIGTLFTDNDVSSGLIRYYYFNGPWTGILSLEKQQEKEWSNYTISTSQSASKADTDYDVIQYAVVYKAATWDAGVGGAFYNDKTNYFSGSATFGASALGNSSFRRHRWVPYFRGTFGGLYFEAEVNYWTGDWVQWETAGLTNVTLGGWSYYAKAQYAIGPAYLGALYANVAGDDGSTGDKYEGGYPSGREFKPCLLFINSDYDYWTGPISSKWLSWTLPAGNSAYQSYGAGNYNLWQVFAGFKPIQKLELFASYSMATMNQKTTWGGTYDGTGKLVATTYVDDSLAKEFDVTATYKIYDNLSYMIGYGYLWAGDAFKGSTTATTISNDWLLMHKLTLTF